MAVRYLIVGGDSTLGKRIRKKLLAQNCYVITTTRRPMSVSDTCLYLDLEKDVNMWPIPESINVAFICAAVTSQAQCCKNSAKTWRINTLNTSLLSARLVESGIFVIFPSTNLVFDGEIPYTPDSAVFSPCTTYGQQKAETETALKFLDSKVAIVRLTKVFTGDLHIIMLWRNLLQADHIIHPYKDMFLSPLSLDFVAEVLVAIGKEKLSGIFQISADQDISYAEIAKCLARSIHADPDLVQPTNAGKNNMVLEHIPKHTTLDTSKMVHELRFEIPAAWEVIHSVLQDGHEFI